MNTRNTSLFLVFCALFSFLFSASIGIVAYIQKIDFPIDWLFAVFFIGFCLSFLFFSLFYQRIIFGRIEETLVKLRKLHVITQINAEKFTEDISDPIERFNAEIIQLSNDRQKELEQLQKLENYRKEFLGNVSHELKTPIFNIQGYISTLIDGGIHDDKINIEYLKRADKSVDRMINIIDDLETISQLETGSLSLDMEKFNVLEMAQDICKQIEIQAQKKNITLKIISEKESIKVIADRYRIRQVFANLLTNSIKYGKENGETTITFYPEKTFVTITIADNGIGIEAKHLPRIFERFYRVDKGRSREQGGTGLGLSIVKHIIEAHHQTISVSSKENEGTTFTFTLSKS